MHDARHEVVRRGYDEIADRYLAARVTGGDLALLPELVGRLSSGDVVLDAGCGAGLPGGVALLCLGAGDVAEDHDPESWLGAPMFWSHFDAETNLEMLRASGFDIIRHELVADPMHHGRHLFALVSGH